jgi:DNA polymerase
MFSNEPVAKIDFESRSACSLRKSGSWRYSLDPSTEVLCLCWRMPYWEPEKTGLWHPAFPHLGIEEGDDWDELYELLDWIDEGGLVEAHSAFFERGIWRNQMERKYGFPPIPHSAWRCSAAKAATHALPRNLEDAVDALKLDIEKDMVGSKTMKKVAQPRKAKKAEYELWLNQYGAGRCVACKGKGTVKKQPCSACKGQGEFKGRIQNVPPMPVLWHESRELFERLWDYCRVDVLAEEGLSAAIPDLNPQEVEMYLMDQAVNERGFMLDRNAIEIALALVEEEAVKLTAELVILTGGQVQKATQRAKMMDWFQSEGLVLVDTQAATIDSYLSPQSRTPLSPVVTRGLEIMRALGRSSTAKYVAMRNWICPDDRVHGGLLYHGAATGRWSGAGIQPHNFPKGKIKKDTAGIKWNMETAWDAINAGDADALAESYGSVMEPLSQALRGCIIASPGQQLYVADYASIEARVLLWLAHDEENLGIFRRGEDIYCSMAEDIYGYPCTKEDHPNERALGKVAVLGLGYQMGAPKFIDTALAMEGLVIDEPQSVSTVQAYRQKFWRVVSMWKDQEQAAIRATQRPGMTVNCGRVSWLVEDGFLYCTLPSGRRLAYPQPKVKSRLTPWGEPKDQLSFHGVNPVTRQWQTQTTYGGMLVENQTQAVARDLMAEAMLRCERSGVYTPVLSVHDELIAEADPQQGDVKAFEALMAQNPLWAKGLPVEAEGWTGVRYHK